MSMPLTGGELGCSLRRVARRPGIPIAVVLMLALGIGATTAVFSLFHQILVRPLPVPEPDRLVNLVETGQKAGTLWCADPGCAGDYALTYPMLRELEAQQDVFTGIAGHHGTFEVNLAFADRAQRGRAMLVSGSYFPVLRLEPAVGRLIGPDDEPRIGEARVVVLSHDYWESQFGSDAGVVGRTLTVNGESLTIIGVAPDGFSGTVIGTRPDIFVPLTLRESMQPAAMRFQRFEDPFAYWVHAFARLRPGVTLDRAAAQLAALHAGILAELEPPPMPGTTPEMFLDRRISLKPGARGQSSLPDTAATPLRLLLAVTVLLPVIVCANIASLLLVGGLERSGEMAVRASLGADRRRIAGQLLMEAAAPALVGVLAGLPIAAAALQVAARSLPAELVRGLQVRLDPWAAVLAVAASLATVLLVALVPAWRAARTDPVLTMKAGAVQAGGARGVLRLRGVLVTAQIAVSMVLLVLAGLFARSLVNVARVDLGFDADSLIVFDVAPGLSGYDLDRAAALGERIMEELSALPGVANVAMSTVPLLTGGSLGFAVTVEGFDVSTGADSGTTTNSVSPGFFATLSMPVRAGRDFTAADDLDAPRVAIVNDAFVRKFRLGNDALGKRVGIGRGVEPDIEIVGVVADTKYAGVKDASPPQLFTPLAQQGALTSLQFYVRAAADPAPVLRAIPALVARAAPSLPIDDLGVLGRRVRDNVFVDRVVTLLAVSFAALATLLAAIGLYGLVSYSVVQRKREFGLRLALGAEPNDLRRLVRRHVGAIGAAGGLLGLAAALGVARGAETLLFGLSVHDPLVLTFAAGVLAAVVAAAGYAPALRASSTAPMEALRDR